MSPIYVTFLNRLDIEELALTNDEILAAIETSLGAQGRGQTVIEPRVHLAPGQSNGHFNVLRGAINAPVDRAGIKVVGDFVDNYQRGLPSEVALLTLYDPATGVPRAVMDATVLTWLRTAAVTAIGARRLARPDAAVVGHLGARGTALSNLRALAACFPLREIRIASRRAATRDALAARIADELGVTARAVERVDEAVDGADIVVESTRLERPEILIRSGDVKPGALVVTYGWVMAVDPALPLSADKLVVDDWAQCRQGGQLHPLIENGQLTRARVHAEIGEIVAGLRPGRTSPDERIVFWHRGFAISDIVLGQRILDRAEARGVGQMLTLLETGAE